MEKNVVYMDTSSQRIKTATHCTFDVAASTHPPTTLSAAQHAVQHVGYANHHTSGKTIDGEDKHDTPDIIDINMVLQVQLLAMNATMIITTDYFNCTGHCWQNQQASHSTSSSQIRILY
jgi:hypothetical protein